jgi:hypothetical protein
MRFPPDLAKLTDKSGGYRIGIPCLHNRDPAGGFLGKQGSVLLLHWISTFNSHRVDEGITSTDRAGEKSAEILREEKSLVSVGIEQNDASVKSQKIKSYKRSAPSDASLNPAN